MTEKKTDKSKEQAEDRPVSKGQEIETYNPANAPVSFADIQNMGKAFFESKMFPSLGSAAQAIVKIQAGRELGLGAVYSMQRLYMVDGKLGMAAETMGALIKRGNKYSYRVKEHTDDKCSIEFFENGKLVYTSTFTLKDAQRAMLVKAGGAWQKYPRALLFSRALSQGARIVAPDAIGGGYTLEELQSIKEGGEGVIEGEYKEVSPPEGSPPTENTEAGGQSAQGLDGKSEGNPENDLDTDPPPLENLYASLLEQCPEHKVPWQQNKFGKSYHRQGTGFCNLYDFFKKIGKAQQEGAGLTPAQGNDLCKQMFGTTFSKITEEQVTLLITEFDKIAAGTSTYKVASPMVAEATETLGAKVTPKQGKLVQ